MRLLDSNSAIIVAGLLSRPKETVTNDGRREERRLYGLATAQKKRGSENPHTYKEAAPMYTTISNLVQTAVEFGRTYWPALLLGLLALLTVYGVFMKLWFQPGKMNYIKFLWYFRQRPIRYGYDAKKIQLCLIEQVLEDLATDYYFDDQAERNIAQPYGVGAPRNGLNPQRDLKAYRRAHVRVYRSKNAFWNAQNAGKAFGYRLKDSYKNYVRKDVLPANQEFELPLLTIA